MDFLEAYDCSLVNWSIIALNIVLISDGCIWNIVKNLVFSDQTDFMLHNWFYVFWYNMRRKTWWIFPLFKANLTARTCNFTLSYILNLCYIALSNDFINVMEHICDWNPCLIFFFFVCIDVEDISDHKICLPLLHPSFKKSGYFSVIFTFTI